VDPSHFSNFAIRFAAGNGHDEVVELLLKDKRVDPSAQMNNALIEASKNGHDKVRTHRLLLITCKVVSLLVTDDRVDPLTQRCAALVEAVRYGREEVVEILLQKKPIAEIPEKDLPSVAPELHRALETARRTGHEVFADSLVSSGKIPQSIFELFEAQPKTSM
jgi:ankyrin repeat protein